MDSTRMSLLSVSLLRLRGFVVGATILATAPSPLGAAPPAKVYAEAEVDKAPRLLTHDAPKPPVTPGEVVSITLSWTVSLEGAVENAKVDASASPEVDAAVLTAVRAWRYEPGMKKGKAVAVRVVRKYSFGQYAKD